MTFYNPYPSKKNAKTDQKNTNPKFTFGLFLMVFGLLSFVLFASSEIWERLLKDPNLDTEAVEAVKKEAEDIKSRHENWIQYKLVAINTMKRPCLRCPNGIKTVTVRKGEVYKYGITTQGQARYTSTQYSYLDVRLLTEFEGNYTECKNMEIDKILSYQFLPESQKPEVKLIRPPGNAKKS